MSTMTRRDEPSQLRAVIGGVDTHRDVHVGAVIDSVGRLLGVQQFTTDAGGHRALLGWMNTFGEVVMIGIEGTGSYGLGLARHLTRATTAQLVEIDRPDRRMRRRRGKSDAIDAEAAARTALSTALSTATSSTSGPVEGPAGGPVGGRAGRGRVAPVPKVRDGAVEALRNLRVARRSAVEQRADVVRQMKSLIVTAPDQLRARLREMTTPALVATCAALRPDPTRIAEPTQATKTALRLLAHRHRHLSEEITTLEQLINPLVAKINPALLAITGVGPDIAGQLLVTAGANPTRISTEAAFAMLCGAAPVPASSGNTRRMRLNRSGDRQANAALHRIVITRMNCDPNTQAYLKRRATPHDLTKKEAIRTLKRYVAREIYPALINPHQPLDKT